jgi:hypothetical protein
MITTYITLANDQAILCLDCGLISFNPNDVRERYCGNCHEFHDAKEVKARVREHFASTPAAEVVASVERILDDFRAK